VKKRRLPISRITHEGKLLSRTHQNK